MTQRFTANPLNLHEENVKLLHNSLCGTTGYLAKAMMGQSGFEGREGVI